MFYAACVRAEFGSRADLVEDVNRGFNGGETAAEWTQEARALASAKGDHDE